MRVPIGVPGGGEVWSRVDGDGGGGFPMENEGQGEGAGDGRGVGWEPAKEPAKLPFSKCARVCQNYPLANYPLVSPRLK